MSDRNARAPLCNGCGLQRPPSKEHLIHAAVGRVILGQRNLSTREVRHLLRTGYLGEYVMTYVTENEDTVPAGRSWLDGFIRNLICGECNQGWARRLEEEAGRNIYDVVHLYGKTQGPLLRRWAVLFR